MFWVLRRKSTVWSACLAEHIVRSRDLQQWEESPVAGSETIIMGLPDGNVSCGLGVHYIC
jgi:hypothetical protein